MKASQIDAPASQTPEASPRPSGGTGLRLFDLALGRVRGAGDGGEVDISVGLNRALAHARSRSARLRSSVHEDVELALQSIEAALFAIDEIRELLREACDIASAAAETTDLGGRALLAERYDDVRAAVDDIAGSAEFDGVTLLAENARALEVELGQKARYLVAPFRLNIGPKGLDLPPPETAFAEAEEIAQCGEALLAGLVRLDRAAETYCRDAQVLGARVLSALATDDQPT